MIKYGTKIIADVGNYLQHKGISNFCINNIDSSEIKEIPLNNNVVKNFDNTFTIGGVFRIKLTNTLKKDLISLLFSNDDQIAIILNKELGEVEEEMYNFMQSWRAYFSDIIKKIKELNNDTGGTQSISGEYYNAKTNLRLY